MKIIAIIACLALTSCAGLTLSATTPYGDISSTNGQTAIAVKPIVIHEK